MDKYATVILRAGAWIAEIAPGFGMNTISLQYQGKPVLRSPNSLESLEKDPCVYGTPLLLPPNRTADGCFAFDGETYCLPINEPQFRNHLHGVLHSECFAVTRQDRGMLQGIFENQGLTFPFPYRMLMNCCLKDRGYFQEFIITNTGCKDMPLTFGLHTVFANCGKIQIPIEKRWEVDNRYLPTGHLLKLDEAGKAYRQGMEPKGKLVRGFFTAAGHMAQIGEFCYRTTENFDQWVLWNGSGQEGFCAVEPLQGAVNSLNSGEGLRRLKPGESVRYATVIYHQ